MPLSIVVDYNEMKEQEVGILQRQFENSFFFQHTPNAKPSKLAIFDFDSTLFFSPLLSPTIWHPKLIHLATYESVYGPGWWRDLHSLDLGPMEELEKTAWKGFWNNDIVQQARECIADPNIMTVVLTGRRYHPFHRLIPVMLESKQLKFDLIGLRPDPEVANDKYYEFKKGMNRPLYNLSESIFRSTMHFKSCFILNLIHNIPSLRKVTMWDDRVHHVDRFKEYLDQIKSRKYIDVGEVVYVPAIKPKYNPEWEKKVMAHIIETHNQAVYELHHNGSNTSSSNNKERRVDWVTSALVDTPAEGGLHPQPEDPLQAASHKRLYLTSVPTGTGVQLSSQSTNTLYRLCEPLYLQQMAKKDYFGGEQPVFFGDYVYIAPAKVLSPNNIPVGKLNKDINIKIKAYSRSRSIPCFALKVEIAAGDDHDSSFILPLWYRPSDFHALFKPACDFNWKELTDEDDSPLAKSVVLSGKVSYFYRLIAKESNKRRLSTTETGPSAVTKKRNALLL